MTNLPTSYTTLRDAILKHLLSSVDPRFFPDLIDQVDDDGLRSILHYYVLRPKAEMMSIWQRKAPVNPDGLVPDDERVEDAALDDDDVVDALPSENRMQRQVA